MNLNVIIHSCCRSEELEKENLPLKKPEDIIFKIENNWSWDNQQTVQAFVTDRSCSSDGTCVKPVKTEVQR